MTDAVVANTYKCPVCGEQTYILVTTVLEVVTEVICLQCGYDGSNSQDFITL